jgi:hypothetical protein
MGPARVAASNTSGVDLHRDGKLRLTEDGQRHPGMDGEVGEEWIRRVGRPSWTVVRGTPAVVILECQKRSKFRGSVLLPYSGPYPGPGSIISGLGVNIQPTV